MYAGLTHLLIISTFWSVLWSLPWSTYDAKDWRSSDDSVRSFFKPVSFPKTVTFDRSIFNDLKDHDDDDDHIDDHFKDVDDTPEDTVDSELSIDHEDHDDDIIAPVNLAAADDISSDIEPEIWKNDEHSTDANADEDANNSQHSFADSDDHHKSCDKCPPGYGFVRMCNATHATKCEPCESGRTYSDHVPHFRPCQPCSKCGTGMYEDYPCTVQTDTFCDSCAERRLWPAISDVMRLNKDFTKKCGAANEVARDTGDSVAAEDSAASQEVSASVEEEDLSDQKNSYTISAKIAPSSKALEKSFEIVSGEHDDNSIDINEPELKTESNQERLDRLYKSVGEELKELEEQEQKQEIEDKKLFASSAESDEEFRLSFKNAKKFDFAPKSSHSSASNGPEIIKVLKKADNIDSNDATDSSSSSSFESNDSSDLTAGVVQETISVVETKFAVDEQSSTVTATVLEGAAALAEQAVTKKISYPLPPNPRMKMNKGEETLLKIAEEKLSAGEEQETFVKKALNDANNIVYKPSAHNYPYDDLVHASTSEFHWRQMKKAITVYSITAGVSIIILILFVFYARTVCARRRLIRKLTPSNLTDQDDRIITECARKMAEKEAPKKRPSLFEQKSQDDSLNVMENPLITYLEEDYKSRELVHGSSTSTESLIPADKQQQQKRSKTNNAVIV